MSEKLGPLAFGKKDEEIFLGREIATHRDFSEKTAQEIDAEIRGVIHNAEKRTTKLLKDNIESLHAISKALLEREILDAEEIDKLMRGEELPEKAKGRRYATFGPKDTNGAAAPSPENDDTDVAEADPDEETKE